MQGTSIPILTAQYVRFVRSLVRCDMSHPSPWPAWQPRGSVPGAMVASPGIDIRAWEGTGWLERASMYCASSTQMAEQGFAAP
jgi:hypothetical protein